MRITDFTIEELEEKLIKAIDEKLNLGFKLMNCSFGNTDAKTCCLMTAFSEHLNMCGGNREQEWELVFGFDHYANIKRNDKKPGTFPRIDSKYYDLGTRLAEKYKDRITKFD